ncbi:MAG: VPDSG-CTERM sorting domain-containing protein [Opitutales bacterium]
MSGNLLGSASLSAVPDTGSTAAVLGAGVFVLAAARRRLG